MQNYFRFLRKVFENYHDLRVDDYFAFLLLICCFFKYGDLNDCTTERGEEKYDVDFQTPQFSSVNLTLVFLIGITNIKGFAESSPFRGGV